MNTDDKRLEVGARIMTADEAKLGSAIELLLSMSSGLFAAEDDSAQQNYAYKGKKYQILSMLQNLTEPELDAMLAFLPPAPEFELGDEDLAIIEERRRRYEAGETKMFDAFESLERIRAKYKKSKE